MKNIFEIMKEFGIEIPKDKEKDFESAVLDNYKTVADYNKQTEKLNKANESIKANEKAMLELQGKLDDFKDVDVTELNKTISGLKEENARIEDEYRKKIDERDFNDLVKDAINAAHGKNATAITALLDIQTLMQSKNQKEDVTAAIKALTEKEDSKMLFGEADPTITGTGNPIGDVGGKGMTAEQKEDADCRAAMGLPPVNEGGTK